MVYCQVIGIKAIYFISAEKRRKEINAYQKANVAADKVIMLYTNGPAIKSASL